ncbi:Acetyltransferase involved in cellulose biosynthesis, CelD/BcsL family [Rhizobium sp. NFR07]|uniref:GNAT family N-acetyltransferase n=1 Tax=Rhizobium sp. NFR07 TaxID=1566262 RepID=UPI0008E72657|nr:GNAT family N-acetyltransferase [Rhizobium sp. NFR07]SFB50481.1 Acetyltransferase involved in cellulose biosynthesis, CelD/BcsL family [Rhizobium sp. NFR07]
MAALADQDETNVSQARSGLTADEPSMGFADLEIALVHDDHSLEEAWRSLQQREWNSLNQSLDWCRAWAEAHEHELLIVTGSVRGRILLLLPLEIVASKFCKTARFPGGRFNNINTGLFSEELVAPNPEELQQFRSAVARALRGRADLLVLDQVPLQWKGLSHPLGVLASVENQNRSFQLPLLSTMEATLAQLNAKTRRKKFRSQTRKLEALGGFEHVVATSTQQQHMLLDCFFSQKGARLQAFGLPDVFHSAETRDFLHRLIGSPAHGRDTSLAMQAIRLKGEHEGHIAAVSGLSRKGDHVLCQFSSIDESIGAEASPGELLFWLAVERSIAEGATLFDFGIGDQLYKRSWCSQETVHHDILLPVSTRGRVMAPLLVAETRLKAAIKKRPRLYALAQRWRAQH